MKVADKLKSALLGEMANAEWELLEEREWDEEGPEQGPLNVMAPSLSSGPKPEVQDTSLKDEEAVVRATETEHNSDDAESSKLPSEQRIPVRPRGTSGWTKLKSR
jgi:hypothetical protein